MVDNNKKRKKNSEKKNNIMKKKDKNVFLKNANNYNNDFKEAHRLKSWKELPIGAVIDTPGNSEFYHTGSWRSERPVFIPEKCKQCMICWKVCPDNAILTDEKGNVIGIDYNHCKGCGLCSEECPFGALKMILESEAEDKKDLKKSYKGL